jgi:hypothetical protein
LSEVIDFDFWDKAKRVLYGVLWVIECELLADEIITFLDYS